MDVRIEYSRNFLSGGSVSAIEMFFFQYMSAIEMIVSIPHVQCYYSPSRI